MFRRPKPWLCWRYIRTIFQFSLIILLKTESIILSLNNVTVIDSVNQEIRLLNWRISQTLRDENNTGLYSFSTIFLSQTSKRKAKKKDQKRTVFKCVLILLFKSLIVGILH